MLDSGVFLNSIEILWDEVPDASAYPFSIPSIASMESLTFKTGITFFCGENGTGKSTLLEAISIAFGLNPEGGSKNYTFSTNPTHSQLFEYLRLDKSIYKPADSFFVRSDTLFNLISETDALEDDLRYYDGVSLHKRSHGEGLLTLVSRRFGTDGLYILDEPEAGLSQSAQISLLCEMSRLRDAGSQFIVATHSPILLMTPGVTIYQFDEEVSSIDAKDSLEWIMMRRFLDDPETVIESFLEL